MNEKENNIKNCAKQKKRDNYEIKWLLSEWSVLNELKITVIWTQYIH